MEPYESGIQTIRSLNGSNTDADVRPLQGRIYLGPDPRDSGTRYVPVFRKPQPPPRVIIFVTFGDRSRETETTGHFGCPAFFFCFERRIRIRPAILRFSNKRAAACRDEPSPRSCYDLAA